MPSIVNSRCIKHPNTFLLQKGETSLVSDISAVDQSIRLILTTAKGELFGDPDFGCRLYEYMFEFEGEALYSILRREISDNLNKQEPRIYVSEDNIDITEEGVDVIINITYNLRYTDYESSFTYIAKRQEEAT